MSNSYVHAGHAEFGHSGKCFCEEKNTVASESDSGCHATAQQAQPLLHNIVLSVALQINVADDGHTENGMVLSAYFGTSMR